MQCNQTNQWSSTLNYMPFLLSYDEDTLESSQVKKNISTLLAISYLFSLRNIHILKLYKYRHKLIVTYVILNPSVLKCFKSLFKQIRDK